jgi:hypothetical protein
MAVHPGSLESHGQRDGGTERERAECTPARRRGVAAA